MGVLRQIRDVILAVLWVYTYAAIIRVFGILRRLETR